MHKACRIRKTRKFFLSRSLLFRALGCADTQVAYGSTTGTAFSDFTGTNPWPCGVDITDIRIRSGNIVDAIQVTYKTVDGRIISGERRGGNGGREDLIRLDDGERITGATGMVCNNYIIQGGVDNGRFVTQLAFFSEKHDGQKVVYGPYGSGFDRDRNCTTFAVNGKINSIFGRILTANRGLFTGLGSIGFYYEDESRGMQNTE